MEIILTGIPINYMINIVYVNPLLRSNHNFCNWQLGIIRGKG